MSRATHDRTDFHIGIENDYFELLSGPVGALPAGTDLHTALEYIHNLILSRETSAALTRSIAARAVIRRTLSVTFTGNARITVTVTVTGAFTANAIARRTTSFTFTADAVKRRATTSSLTGDAWINLAGVHVASLTADSIIKSRIITAIQWRSFNRTMTSTNVLPNTPMIRLYNKSKFR